MSATISIGALSKQTGVSTHTIRVWESRHGLLQPARSDGGTRLFSDSDVHRVRLVRDLVSQGHALGSLASLDNEQLHDLLHHALPDVDEAPNVTALRDEFVASVEAFDSRVAQRVLSRAAILLEPIEFLQHFVIASLVHIGQRWHDGSLRIAHEHFATNAVRALLFSLSNTYPITRQSEVAISATLPTESHEVGALTAALCARMHGWNAIYLGTRLPAEEIVYTAERSKASVVMVSCVAGEESVLQSELEHLERALGERTRLLVGGRQAQRLVLSDATKITKISELDRLLR